MWEKKFIGFKVAMILALIVDLWLSLVFYNLFFRIHKTLIDWKIICFASLFVFLLLTSILFQLQNIRLVSYLEKENLPTQRFLKTHTVLLICDCFGTIGGECVIYFIVRFAGIDLTRDNSLQWFIALPCVVILCTNLITIVYSLHLRTFLRIRQIRQEQDWLEEFGK